MLIGVTLGTPAGWVELEGVATEAAAVSSRALRSEMFWVGVVMPLNAAIQLAIAFMSLSEGMIDGLVIVHCPVHVCGETHQSDGVARGAKNRHG